VKRGTRKKSEHSTASQIDAEAKANGHSGKVMKKSEYEERLRPLHIRLTEVQRWLLATGRRLVIIFEGRDTAGKGGAINAIASVLNPRYCRVVALPKPTERERTEWYFQRYVAHLPAAGEIVLFDRSWYNRAGVEHVMGFCTEAEYQRFLAACPVFERLLVDDGILLFKYWFLVDQVFQEQRFAERVADPLKRWKISPIDLAARTRYKAYGEARDAMLHATHTPEAPWYLVNANDQRRARLNMIQHLLDSLPEHKVPEPKIKLPRLKGKPAIEDVRGPAIAVPERY
jgi:polyphosphate kinase 2